MRKIFHIEFKEPIDGRSHYYFGSKMAIFKTFSKEIVGISYKYLTTLNLSEREYNGKKCTIREGQLVTSRAAE